MLNRRGLLAGVLAAIPVTALAATERAPSIPGEIGKEFKTFKIKPIQYQVMFNKEGRAVIVPQDIMQDMKEVYGIDVEAFFKQAYGTKIRVERLSNTSRKAKMEAFKIVTDDVRDGVQLLFLNGDKNFQSIITT